MSNALAAALRPVISEEVRNALADLERTPAEKQLADMNGLCKFIHCSRPTARNLIAQGLPFVEVGDHRRFDLEEVLLWLRARRSNS